MKKTTSFMLVVLLVVSMFSSFTFASTSSDAIFNDFIGNSLVEKMMDLDSDDQVNILTAMIAIDESNTLVDDVMTALDGSQLETRLRNNGVNESSLSAVLDQISMVRADMNLIDFVLNTGLGSSISTGTVINEDTDLTAGEEFEAIYNNLLENPSIVDLNAAVNGKLLAGKTKTDLVLETVEATILHTTISNTYAVDIDEEELFDDINALILEYFGNEVAALDAGDIEVITALESNFESRLNDFDADEKAAILAALTALKASDDNGGGGNGGGGGASTPTTGTTTTVTISKGGTVKAEGVQIVLPANAFGKDIKITVAKIADPSKLPVGNKMVFAGDVFEITKDITGNFEKEITISLPFNKAKFDTTKYDLAVFWLNEKTNEWIKLDNIKVDLATGTVSGDVNHFTKFAVMAVEKAAGPTDIAGHWAEAAIKQLVEAGAINGYPDNTFKADNNITRAEFAKVLVNAFKLEAKAGKVFGDTANHWAKDVIATAEANGIVSGYDANTFGPDDQITREQMAVMIVKAAKLDAAAAGKTFTDGSTVSAWAQEAVNTAVGKGVMGGYPDNSFKPQGKATRAEAVTVIVNALK